MKDRIIDELRDKAKYKSELIKAKIRDVGNEKFQELKLQYKEKITDRANERLDEIRDQIKSVRLVDQVEDGTYYGVNPEFSEQDTVNYSLEFRGDAVKYSNSDVVKDVSGNLVLELANAGDVNAKLKVIGGEFVVMDPETGDVLNVWDASFGRARVLFDRDAMQVTVNAVDLNGQHSVFRMHAETSGVFPLESGEFMDIHATQGRTSISGAWILDFDGTLSVDTILPLDEFTDVEIDAQTDIVSAEITEETTEEFVDEVKVDLTDILTDEELSDFTDEEIRTIQEELEAEILAELEDEVIDDISADVQVDVQEAIDVVVDEG